MTFWSSSVRIAKLAPAIEVDLAEFRAMPAANRRSGKSLVLAKHGEHQEDGKGRHEQYRIQGRDVEQALHPNSPPMWSG
jgi:hypothetical protein